MLMTQPRIKNPLCQIQNVINILLTNGISVGITITITGGDMTNNLLIDLEEIEATLQKAETMEEEAKRIKKEALAKLSAYYKGAIDIAYKIKGDIYGVTRLDCDNHPFSLEVDTPKKVSWDGKTLEMIGESLAENGHNPINFIDVSYNVPENRYKEWSEPMKKLFDEARTVTPGTMKITLKRKSDV